MEYFDTHVLGNYERYLRSEDELSVAATKFPSHSNEYSNATDCALRDAMNASTSAHHLADHVFETYKRSLPNVVYEIPTLEKYRDFLNSKRCIYIGTERIVNDLKLLGDIADAHKHFKLRNPNRKVTAASATLVVSTAWGELAWGEFKWGGTPQVVVSLQDGGRRALSSVLKNVIEMWKIEIQTHNL